MRQNKTSHGLEFLVGIIVVCALATAKNFERLQILLGQIFHALALFLLVLLKMILVGTIVCGICYGIYKFILWANRFVRRVNEIDKRTRKMEEVDVADLWRWVHALRDRISSVESDVGVLQREFFALTEEAKKAKELPTDSLAAVVSEIKKGGQ